jgi:Leucine-rich repeat (LRR) protein
MRLRCMQLALLLHTPYNSCSAEWSELQSWQVEVPREHSVLCTADLSYNNITSMRPLADHCNLQRLNLSSNGIKVIAGLEGLLCLRHLDLSCNSITKIQGLDGLPLVELNLSDNNITVIQNLPCEVSSTATDNNNNNNNTTSSSSSSSSSTSSSKSVALRRLNLARNAITDLSGLQHCTSVVALDLTGNAVAAVRQTEWLQNCALLRELSMAHNPVAALEWYRLRVLLRLQSLTLLDSEPVTASEKVKALNLAGGAGSDLANRQRVFEAAFAPDEMQWRDMLPPYVEQEHTPRVCSSDDVSSEDSSVLRAMAG